jgi:hypothetical protein
MRYYLNLIYVVICAICFCISCNTESTPNNNSITDTKSTTTKTVTTPVEKSKPKDDVYYKTIAEELNLNPRKAKLIRQLDRKYNFIIKDLKKDGKWLGKANAKARQNVLNQKNTELEKKLGKGLFKRYTEFNKDWKY